MKNAVTYSLVSAVAILAALIFVAGRPPAFCSSGEKPPSNESICAGLVSGIKRNGFLNEAVPPAANPYTCSVDRSFTSQTDRYGFTGALFSDVVAVSFTYAMSDKAKRYHGNFEFWYEDIEMTPCGDILHRGGIGQ
jgi:hypothetical protein